MRRAPGVLFLVGLLVFIWAEHILKKSLAKKLPE
jgi:hypothetical protein